MGADRFGARVTLDGPIDYFRLDRLSELGIGDPARLPMTVKILLENLLHHADTRFVTEDDVQTLATWNGTAVSVDRERPFVPSRVLLQDFTGVPAVVDLAAMRTAMVQAGGDAAKIDPLVPVDLVIDHSVQVDAFGFMGAYGTNIEREYERNAERYTLLRWAAQAFNGFRVVPPGMGIVHQVNLEYLATVAAVRRDADGKSVVVADTLVGTDSHTTMVNGIGVLGWGVGGIEAEACMLGQPLFLLTPVVTGVKFVNSMQPGTTATDLVLTLTEKLRAHGVVNKFVEFCGSGLSSMSAADRATLSNMAPEYGATAALFPVDDQTLTYLRQTGRTEAHITLIDRYARAQGMYRTDDSAVPIFSELIEIDLATIEPSVAGPKRPQDRVPLSEISQSFTTVYRKSPATNGDIPRFVNEGGNPDGETAAASDSTSGTRVRHANELHDGSVVIAAITSCTNTSNPVVMIGAGLLAKKAIERGMVVPDYVKTSLAPGSRVVTDYLNRAGLLSYLEDLRFNVVGYGCTTCIGNSGPLPAPVAERVENDDLSVVAVLSGNRNFEGRIHPQVRAAYLASPPLVVAFALAGTVQIDLTTEPIGTDRAGASVYLHDIWPSADEVSALVAAAVGHDLFTKEYASIFDGDERWLALPAPVGALFDWKSESTYVQLPPFFANGDVQPHAGGDIHGARVLALLGDSITTDHISPAGTISATSPAAQYLRDHGVELRDFNTYGARRGNHEVMMRGTFANTRLRNELAQGKEGGYTTHIDSGELMSIYDAAMRYEKDNVPLVVLAGKEYGSGSSRDWAAKGPALLGVRAVIAQSFERIHRSNLVGMGVLPLQFHDGESASSLGLMGNEHYDVVGLEALSPRCTVPVVATKSDGTQVTFNAICRLDSATDVDYYRHGGILPMVLRELMQ